MKIRHYFTEFNGLGGVNRIMREHHIYDSQHRLESDFIIYTEKATVPQERIRYLGIQGWRTIGSGRRVVANTVNSSKVLIALFHGLWGLENLGDLENADHKVLILHGETPGLKPFLREYGPHLSGIGCVSRPLMRLVSESCPNLSSEQIVLIPYPIEPSENFLPSETTRPLRVPIKIGVCGRVVREQKRVDRIPLFCEEMKKSGIPFELEILGDGTDSSWLKERLSDFPELHFLGRQSGVQYWESLAAWDSILFVSDYEGLPIAMLEAMSCGVIPVFPKIGCGGDDYVEEIHHNLMFDPHNVSEAVKCIEWLNGLSKDSITKLRASCLDLVSPHTMDAYFQAVKTLLDKTSSLPIVATSEEFPKRSAILDRIPMRLLERSAKWRVRKQMGRELGSSLGYREGLTGTYFRDND
jgi:glycosyltransferase involved in cell wall biosynthesis